MKIIFSFIILFSLTIVLPIQYNPNTLNAGVITWGAKKIIGGTIGLIFNVSSEKLVEIQIDKLLQYLQKHPEYKQYAIDKTKKMIDKHPKYKAKGYLLLNKLLQKVDKVRINVQKKKS